MAEFRMPSLGADMDAGVLVEWLVKPGDKVSRGDIVAVVETQKGAIDVEIFDDGFVQEIVVPVGVEVPVDTILAILGDTHMPKGARPPPASCRGGAADRLRDPRKSGAREEKSVGTDYHSGRTDRRDSRNTGGAKGDRQAASFARQASIAGRPCAAGQAAGTVDAPL